MHTANASTLWHVPYQRNPFFTGREDVLKQLHTSLYREDAVALSYDAQGISGLGGIGKSQTALEYAYRHREEYQAVLWVRAESLTSLTSSLLELASVLELPERHEQDQEVIIQAVLRWFRLHIGWLLIYDNIDDLSIAEPFLPKAGPGHLIFTTRAHAFVELARRLDISQMEPDVGALLLLRRARLLTLQATLEMATPDEQGLARAISQELDGLPLALDQAGAYIKEVPYPLADYLTHYQTRRSDILQRRGNFSQDYPTSVATTWSLAFEKVRQANPAAAELLQFCAFLSPDAIPEELLTAGSAHLGAVLEPMVVNPLLFDLACKEVLRYSLLQRGGDEGTLTIHRLVQTVLRDALPTRQSRSWHPQAGQGQSQTTRQEWMQRAVFAVNATLPEITFTNWSLYERLVSHALTCTLWIEQVPLVTPEATSLLNDTGRYLSERVRYREAKPLYVRALAIREQQLGLMHVDTTQSLNNLAGLHAHQGKYKEAEPLYKRALAIRERLLGDHPDTARSLNNLAELYADQGKYPEAEPLLKRALAISEELLGPLHPQTATFLSNLAGLYNDQGKYAEAKPLYERALAISEQIQGPYHPDTAIKLNNLAGLYEGQRKYTQAEPLYERALAIREQVMGPLHPETATVLNNLAEFYRTQKKYAQMEPLLVRALAIREQALGPLHPDTSSSLNNLAGLYENLGRYAEAEPLYERALAIREQTLGTLHPDTVTVLNNLAELYHHQGQYAQAESVYMQALAFSEQLEMPYPVITVSLARLAQLYQDQGRYAEAEPLLLRNLTICEQQLGGQHIQVATVLGYLVDLYKSQEQYAEAEPFATRALSIYTQTLGLVHPGTARNLNNLAFLYEKQGKYAKAEPLYKRALLIGEQVLGTEHPDTAVALGNLANIYQEQGKYAEAEALYQRALAIHEESLGPSHIYTATSLNNLAQLYVRQGNYTQAQPLLERALPILETVLGQNHPSIRAIYAGYLSFLEKMADEDES